MGSNQQVIVPNRETDSLQFTADRAVVPVCRFLQGEGFNRREYSIELFSQVHGPAAFCTVSKLGCNDNANG